MAPKDFKKKTPEIKQIVEINEHNTITAILRSKPGTRLAMWITAEVPEPQLEVSITPTEINAGESATFSWTSNFTDEVFIDNNIGKVEPSGSMTINPASTTIYTVTAKGLGGTITKEAILTVIRDTTPPTITINHPPQGATFDSLPISVDAKLEDLQSGVDASSIDVLLNGSSIINLLSITAESISGSIDDESQLKQGSNLLEIHASDNAGNMTSQNMAFRYETIALEDQTYIYSRVYDAESLAPLSDAIIRCSGAETRSDSDGYFKLMFGSGGLYKVSISKPGYTEVNRKIYLSTSDEKTIPSAYLTPIDTKTTPIGPEGGVHENSDGTVQVIIPEGALDSVKEIRATRFHSSKALPGDLDETANLEYPIGFLFCADFGPDGTTFSEPATIRVRNTFGFDPGEEIPYAYWDKEEVRWIPCDGMARVDDNGEWLEGTVTHFTSYDINTAIFPPLPVDPDVRFDLIMDCPECMASSVDANTGLLQKGFSIPGVSTSSGSTGLRLAYNSATAYPMLFFRVYYYINNQLVEPPLYSKFGVDSAAFSVRGGNPSSSGGPSFGEGIEKPEFFFQPTVKQHASAGLVWSGINPSGRSVKTGFQTVSFTASHFYNAFYVGTPFWGGMPGPVLAVRSSTGSSLDSRAAWPGTVPSLEPVELKVDSELTFFVVSRAESAFGRGWHIAGLKELHTSGEQVVIVNGDGTYDDYTPGVNYADLGHGAHLESASHNFLYPENMLTNKIAQAGSREEADRYVSRFAMDEITPAPGTDQVFTIDLGAERWIKEIGLEFPRFWHQVSIWDYIKIETSTDNATWEKWGQSGYPTLRTSSDIRNFDALDLQMDSPLMMKGQEKQMRYIRFHIGYPSTNTTNIGSAIHRVHAIGNANAFRRKDGAPWPLLTRDISAGTYTLTDYSGHKTIFSATGHMLEEIDIHGKTTTYQYNGQQISKITYPEGQFMSFAYDGNGRLQRITDSSGRDTTIDIDSEGDLTGVTYPDGSSLSYTYTTTGLMTLENRGGPTKSYTWHDKWPVMTQVNLPNGGVRSVAPWILANNIINGRKSAEDRRIHYPTQLDHDGITSFVTYEDGFDQKILTGFGWKKHFKAGVLQDHTIYANKAKNRLPTVINHTPDGSEKTLILYNSDLQVKQVITTNTDTAWNQPPGEPHAPFAPTNQQTTITKKNLRLTYQNDPALPGFHQVLRIRDYGVDQTCSYNTRNQIASVTDNILARTANYQYDSNGNLIKILYPSGKQTQMTYDANNFLKETINNDGSKKTYTRNLRGEIVSFTDEESRSVKIERDLMGRIIKEISPSGRTVQYEWGDSGCVSCGGESKLTKIIDSGNKEWEFEYDIMGNAIAMTYPDGSKVSLTYDKVGRLASRTNRRGQITRYSYDSFGRFNKITTPEGVTIFQYDNRDRLISLQAPTYYYKYRYGVTSDWKTLAEEHNQTTNLWTQSLTNQWGLPSDWIDSFQWHKMYVYNFTSSTGTPIGPTPQEVLYYKQNYGTPYRVKYTYNSAMQLEHKINSLFQSDQSFGYKYDTGDLVRIRYRPSYWSGTYPRIDEYLTRDKSGAIQNVTLDNEFTVQFNDDLEITAVNHTLPSSHNETYSYDTKGNRVSSHQNTYTYNDLNQLTESATHLYTYDPDGNLTKEIDKATGEQKLSYYSSDNRLKKFEHIPAGQFTAATIATYTYDSYGRRLSKTVNGTTTHFHWEGDNLAMELDDSFTPIRRYTYGIGKDSVEGHIEFSEASSNLFAHPYGWYSYIKDQVGTIYKIHSHQTQTTVTSRHYDTFGNLISQSGPSKGNLGFQSKYYDMESGLNSFYYRYYHSEIGRFISEDPIGFKGGANFYGFALNNPVIAVDPLGLSAMAIIIPALSCEPSQVGKVILVVGAIVAWIVYDECRTKDDCDENTRRKMCPPCIPPVGTRGYRINWKPGRPHYVKKKKVWVPRPNVRYYERMQNPNNCQCYWYDTGDASPMPPEDGAWPMDIN
jgi:RHS repeat-associated protein